MRAVFAKWFDWLAFLAPCVAICLAVGIISWFDHLYFAEFPSDSAVDKFGWPIIPQGPVTRTREVTARFILEILACLLVVASGCAVWWCLYRFWFARLLSRSGWNSIGVCRVVLLIGSGVVTGWFIRWMWYAPDQALDHALGNELIKMAALDRPNIQWSRDWMHWATCVLVLPLLTTTACLIVAQNASINAVKRQLGDLTTVLYWMAGTQFIYAFMQGATLLWVAALLPDGEAAGCRHLAIALSLNFAVMSTLMIACFHVTSVWCVTRHHSPLDQVAPIIEYYKKHWQILLILFPLLAPVLTKVTGLVFGG